MGLFSRKPREIVLPNTPYRISGRVHSSHFREVNVFDTPKWRNAYASDFVAFDVETTGLNPKKDWIVQIAAVRFLNCKPAEEFVTLVHPNGSIPYSATQIHGITDDDVEDAPDYWEATDMLYDFIGKSPTAAYNACFDTDFVGMRSFRFLNEKNNFKIPVVDVLSVARHVVPGGSDYKLKTVSKYLRIPASPNHQALKDALACGLILAEVVKKLHMTNS